MDYNIKDKRITKLIDNFCENYKNFSSKKNSETIIMSKNDKLKKDKTMILKYTSPQFDQKGLKDQNLFNQLEKANDLTLKERQKIDSKYTTMLIESLGYIPNKTIISDEDKPTPTPNDVKPKI